MNTMILVEIDYYLGIEVNSCGSKASVWVCTNEFGPDCTERFRSEMNGIT